MYDAFPAHGGAISPELAKENPEKFKGLLEYTLKNRSEHGMDVWDWTVERGLAQPSRMTLDTTTWLSGSSEKGDIVLGTQPMDTFSRAALLIEPDAFTYPDEVAYRLLHEITHSFLTLTQEAPATSFLKQTAIDIRTEGDGDTGITPLGSQKFYYKGTNKKAKEDVTELITMYAWSPDYAAGYLEYLADPRFATDKLQRGLVSLHADTSAVILGMLSMAVVDNLADFTTP